MLNAEAGLDVGRLNGNFKWIELFDMVLGSKQLKKI